MRAAIAGATIANEVRLIAGGLAGKRLDVIQVEDLMIDTLRAKSKAEDKAGSVSRRSQPQSRSISRSRSQSQSSRDDRAAAENYYHLWARSLQAKLDDAQRSKTTEKPNRVIDHDRNRKRSTPRRP